MKIKSKSKFILLISMILLIAVVMTSCTTAPQTADVTSEPDTAAEAHTEDLGEFTVTFMKVGKADAIILMSENHAAVIDCGETDDGDDVVRYLTDRGIDSLDYLIITHFDKDHVGGAAEVIENISIGSVIVPDYDAVSDEYEAFLDALDTAGLTPTRLHEDLSFDMDAAELTIYPPLEDSYDESDNDYSLAVSATHGENSFLFAGDAEKERLAEFSSQFDLPHTFLKVPHHGRYNKGTKSFLEAVAPKYAIITDTEKNAADDETIEILEGLGCEIYHTYEGDVTAVSDGDSISILQQNTDG